MGASGSLLMATIGLRALHSGNVLDSTGDAHGDVELRSDGTPRLTHLQLGRSESRVTCRAARAKGGAQRVGQRLEHRLELLLERAAARDDDACLAQVGPFALRGLELEELDACGRGIVGSFRGTLDRARAARRLGRRELRLPDAHDVHRRGDLEPAEHAARVLRTPVLALGAVDLHTVDVRRVSCCELAREARREVLAERGGRDDDGVPATGRGHGGDRRGEALDGVGREARVVDGDDLLGAEAREVLCSGGGSRADGEDRERGAGLAGERDGAEGRLADLSLEELCDDECSGHVRSPSLPS